MIPRHALATMFILMLTTTAGLAAADECPQILGRVGLGPVDTVAAAGPDLAAIGSGTVLQLVDISDPTAPAVRGELDLEKVIDAVVVSGGTAFVATPDGIRTIDVSNPRNLRRLGAWDGRLIGDLVVSNGLAYLARSSSGVTVLDVSDPAAPVEIGSLETRGSVNGLDLSGDVLYTAEDSAGVGVLDVGDPSSPSELGFFEVTDRDVQAVAVAVPGERVVAVDRSMAFLLDVSDPAAPAELGSAADLREPGDVVVDGNHAYIAERGVALVVLDISDPANPSVAGELDVGEVAYCEEVVLADGRVLLADTNSSLRVVDVSNPAAPAQLGLLIAPGISYDAALTGSMAVVVDTSIGLRTIDVSDPTSPVVLATETIQDRPASVALSGGNALVGASGIYIYDLANPTAPSLLGSIELTRDAEEMAVAGSLVYVANGGDGLRVIDIGDPTAPVEIGSLMTSGFARGVTVVGSLAYVAANDAGLDVVDVSDPSSPTLLGTVHLDGYAANVSVSGETAFVAAVHDVYVVDVSDPANPSVVDVIEDSAGNSLRGGDLLVLSLGNSVNVYDVSDPTMPSLLGSAETAGRAWNMFRRGATVAVSGERAGLLMLGIGGCLAPGSAPLAGFTWSPAEPLAGLPVQLTDLSVGEPGSWSWSFGDGTTSDQQHPIHTWSADGSYEVTLEVGNGAGSDSTTATVEVTSSDAPPVDEPGAFLTVVPASAHVEGAQSTRWVTDLVLHAAGSSTVVANVYFLNTAGDNSGAVGRSFQVDSEESLRLADVVLSEFGSASGSGALLVGSDARLMVSSRTYNAAGAEGTYGQFIAGFPSGDALDSSVEGRILQLRYEPGDGGFRTNVGAVNLSETATTVDVELFAADGGFLGSFEIALGPFGYGQSNAVFEGLVGGAVRGAYAVVSSDSPGASYLAYGSVVDNDSGDPIYVPARISE